MTDQQPPSGIDAQTVGVPIDLPCIAGLEVVGEDGSRKMRLVFIVPTVQGPQQYQFFLPMEQAEKFGREIAERSRVGRITIAKGAL